MSMEHKAFVFDTEKFHAEIEPVMKDSIKNVFAILTSITLHGR